MATSLPLAPLLAAAALGAILLAGCSDVAPPPDGSVPIGEDRGTIPGNDASGNDAGGNDAGGNDAAGGSDAATGTACGLRYGTSFIYVVGLSKVVKVHLDGEIDELAATLTRNGNGAPFYPGGVDLTTSRITLAGGRTPAGTPNPGWWRGPWPPPGGEGAGTLLDVTTLAITGGASEGPLRRLTAAGNLAVALGGSTVYLIDLGADTSTATALTRPRLPANYRVTEFLDAAPTAFTVLASIAPAAGVNNRAFNVATDGNTWTTTEVPDRALSATAPIVAVRRTSDGRALWFDASGFYIDGIRIRDVRHCRNGNVQADEVYAVAQ